MNMAEGKFEFTHTLALLPKGKKAGILLWGFGGEVRGEATKLKRCAFVKTKRCIFNVTPKKKVHSTSPLTLKTKFKNKILNQAHPPLPNPSHPQKAWK